MNETKEKPDCNLIGVDGNVFSVIGVVSKALRRAGQKEEAKEFEQRAFKAQSYGEVLAMVFDYVTIADPNDYEEEEDFPYGD